MGPLVYVTDLHGDRWKYERAFALAAGIESRLIVNGGDLLPHGPHRHQARFVREFLDPYFAACQAKGIRYLFVPGNDDLAACDPLLEELGRRYPLVASIARRCLPVGAYDFIGLDLVTDFPFRLKDRARMDGPGFVFPFQFGGGIFSSPDGWEEIPDWPARARTLPTIEEELAALPVPRDVSQAIYVLHGPPSGLGLDVVRGGQAVGSEATRRFIGRIRPLLTLHGHIHESPEESGSWTARLDGTVCIQPGQSSSGLTVVVGDPVGMTFERKVIPTGC